MRKYLLKVKGQFNTRYIHLQVSRQRSDIYWLPNDTGHAVVYMVDENISWSPLKHLKAHSPTPLGTVPPPTISLALAGIPDEGSTLPYQLILNLIILQLRTS